MGRFGQGSRRGGGGGGSGGGGGNWGNKKGGKGFISSGGGYGSGSGGGRYGRSSGTDSYYTQDNYGGGYGMGYGNVSSSMMSGGGYGSNQVGQLHEQLRMQESQLAMTSNLLQQQTQLLAEVGMRVGLGGGGRYDRKRAARDYGGYGYDSKRLRRDSGPYGGYRSDSRNTGRQRSRDNRGNDRSKAASSKGKFTPPIADHNKATTYCHVCEVETYTRKMFDSHLEETKHKDKLAIIEADPENENNKAILEKMAKIEELKAALTEECKICDISHSGQGRDHERTDRHNFCKEQVEKGCGWCELAKFDDASHVLQHRNSREHIENMIKKGRKISGTRIEKRINEEGKEVKVIIDDSVVEVDSSVTYCFACDEELATLELMNEHLETDQHKEKFNELKEKAEDENVQDESIQDILKRIEKQKELKVQQSEFCTVCDIPYSGTEDDHVRETLHKYRGQQSARGCTWCDIAEFSTYTEVLRHRATDGHKEVSWKEKENNVKSGRERTLKVTEDKVEIPLFSKGKTYGEDEMMPILGYYCKVCKKYYRKRYDTLKFHCSSENHYRNWKKIKEEQLESSAQFEEIQDAIVKTTRTEMGEIDPDAEAEEMETSQDEHQNGGEGGDGVVADFAEDELLQDTETGDQETGDQETGDQETGEPEVADQEAGAEEMEAEAENSILAEEAEETSPSKGKGTRRGKARRGRK